MSNGRQGLYGLYAVEEVTNRHKKICAVCEKRPVGRRLVLMVVGFSKFLEKKVFCAECAVVELMASSAELDQLMLEVSGKEELR